MKYQWRITIILLSMFIFTQFIGLAVIKADPFNLTITNDQGQEEKVPNPYLTWIRPPEAEQQSDFLKRFLPSILFAFVIAVTLLFLMSKFRLEFILRIWFLFVVTFALGITIFAFQILAPWLIDLKVALVISAGIAVPLAIIKIFGRNFLVHNFTEFLIYPGIAAVFVPILSFWTIIILLLIISVYDMWAVWHSELMQNMAKFQINRVKIFTGFFVPYLSKKTKQMLKRTPKSKLKKKKVKANVAILGGGDVVFPIITAGVMYNASGISAALLVTLGATLGLGTLFYLAEKKKFYPAMPFITAGIFLGIIFGKLIGL